MSSQSVSKMRSRALRMLYGLWGGRNVHMLNTKSSGVGQRIPRPTKVMILNSINTYFLIK